MGKNKKGFSIVSFITISCTIVYLILRVFDAIRINMMFSGNDSTFLYRYLPIALIMGIITYFIIMSSAKNSSKSNLESIKTQLIIAPIIVAVIIFIYGVISVNINIKKITSYSSLFGYTEEELKEEKNEALIQWLITSFFYLGSAELVVFVVKNKIGEKMIDDGTTFNVNSNDPVDLTNYTDNNFSNNNDPSNWDR